MPNNLSPTTNINHGQYCPSWGLSRQRLKRSTRQVFGEPVRGKAESNSAASRQRVDRGESSVEETQGFGSLGLANRSNPQRIEKRSLPLTATPSGLRGFLFSRRAVPSRLAPAQATGGGQPNKGCTEGALLCPSNAKSEAQLLDGLTTATIYNRRGLVAPLLYAAQLVSRDIQTNKGHNLVI